MDKQIMDTIRKNFRSYWPDRETFECFFGISVLLHDEQWSGKGLSFGSNDAPTISFDGKSWQVNSMRTNGWHVLELNLTNKDAAKKVCISDDDIEKFDAYILLNAVFNNTEHEKFEGEDYEDVEDFYGWELS